MAVTFTQTDTAASCGESTMCSGAANLVGQGGMDSTAVDGGTAGTTEQTVKHSSNVADVAACFVQLAPPTDTDWDAGDWTVRLDVTTGNTSITWQEAHICRIDGGACSTVGTLGSTTGLGTTMSAGVHTATVTQGSTVTPAAGEEVYIVYVFDFGGSHGNQQIGVTPSQDIDSPIAVTATVTGTATLGGSADATLSGTKAAVGSATAGGSGDAALGGTAIGVGSATAGGSADLTAAGTVSTPTTTVTGTATLGGSADASVSGTTANTGAATLGGSGAATAAGTGVGTAAVTLGGSGDLSTTGTVVVVPTLTVSGSADLTATGTTVSAGVITGAAELGGSGDIDAAALLTHASSATLGGAGELTAAGTLTTTASDDGMYETRVNSTSMIAQDVENFNQTVTSIDGIHVTALGPDTVFVLMDYTG